MSIIYKDILDSTADFIVIPVNAEGVCGAGLAKQFAARYPIQTDVYRSACRDPNSTIHTMGYLVTRLGAHQNVIFFVTKKTWREDSTRKQLKSVFQAMSKYDPDLLGGRTVATPPLGCGCGRLKQDEVIPLIKRAFINLGAFTNIYDYQPKKQK